ncbi:MAG: transketolase C-terminal domain-containing protein [Candidatus Paceibacterota bacterium]|jgi:transketolase
MILPEQKINPKLFDEDVAQVPIRDGFGEGLLIAGEADSRVVALSADLRESSRSEAFSKKFPDRYFEIGVAEQNLASVGSGLAASGKIPFITSYATFSPGRNWEQIRTTICYNNTNVKIIGSHAGVSVGPDGGTHQALEDIAIMRALPRTSVLSPCDSIEAKKATIAAAKHNGPVYIRLMRNASRVITTEESPFVFGKANILFESQNPQVVFFATGPVVYGALKAARELEGEGIGAVVVNVHTIKPLDVETIVSVAKKCGAAVTVENHQIAGGLGGAIAETLAQEFPVPIEFAGVHDQFGQSGTPEELLKFYGINSEAIVSAAKKVISRK